MRTNKVSLALAVYRTLRYAGVSASYADVNRVEKVTIASALTLVFSKGQYLRCERIH
jgi:hypothetical protein